MEYLLADDESAFVFKRVFVLAGETDEEEGLLLLDLLLFDIFDLEGKRVSLALSDVI